MRAERSLQFRTGFQGHHRASRLQAVDEAIIQRRARSKMRVTPCRCSVAVLRHQGSTRISIDTRNQAACKRPPTHRFPERVNQKKWWIWVSKWSRVTRTICKCQETSRGGSIQNRGSSSRKWCTQTYSTLLELGQSHPSTAMIKSISTTLHTRDWWLGRGQPQLTNKMWWANFSTKCMATPITVLIGTPSRCRVIASYTTATIIRRRRLGTKA